MKLESYLSGAWKTYWPGKCLAAMVFLLSPTNLLQLQDYTGD